MQESARPWVLARNQPLMEGLATWPEARFEYRHSRLLAKAAVLIEKAGGQQ